nr:hypothetical protein [Tanacetum cinerariifolium]
MGLDDIYLPIISNILTRDPFPSVKYAFAIIYEEESHRGGSSNSTPSKPHATAFVSKGYDNKRTVRGPNLNLKCTNYLKPGHTIERCFELVGYPPNYKKPNGQALRVQSQNKIAYNNNTERLSTSSPVSLTNEQMLRTLWHQILGHPTDPVLGALKTRLGFDNKYAFNPCEVCHKAKQTREPFPLSDHKSLDVGELVHLDLWGPYKVTSTEGHKTPLSILAGKSPFFLVYGHEPSLSHIRVFGCLCYASILNNSDKFSSMSEKCVLIGYSNFKRGYKLFSLENKTIIFSRDVKFYETVFPFKLKQIENNFDFGISKELNHENFFDLVFKNPIHSERPDDEGRVTSGSNGTESLSSEEDQGDSRATLMEENTPSEGISTTKSSLTNKTNVSDQPAESVVPRRSSKPSKVPRNLNDFVIEGKVKYEVERVVNYSNLSNDNFCFTSNINKSIEPKTYQEAALDTNWINVMNNEMEALNMNKTWIITDLPPNRKAIGCK